MEHFQEVPALEVFIPIFTFPILFSPVHLLWLKPEIISFIVRISKCLELN